jgi:hypothetical protein
MKINKENIIKIWKSRNQIIEGIRNSVFTRDDVRELANERITTCRSNKCGFYDAEGKSEAAFVKGAESCGSCGCKLAWATKALSYECPKGFWPAVLTETEDAHLKEKLGITDEYNLH